MSEQEQQEQEQPINDLSESKEDDKKESEIPTRFPHKLKVYSIVCVILIMLAMLYIFFNQPELSSKENNGNASFSVPANVNSQLEANPDKNQLIENPNAPINQKIEARKQEDINNAQRVDSEDSYVDPLRINKESTYGAFDQQAPQNTQENTNNNIKPTSEIEELLRAHHQASENRNVTTQNSNAKVNNGPYFYDEKGMPHLKVPDSTVATSAYINQLLAETEPAIQKAQNAAALLREAAVHTSEGSATLKGSYQLPTPPSSANSQQVQVIDKIDLTHDNATNLTGISTYIQALNSANVLPNQEQGQNQSTTTGTPQNQTGVNPSNNNGAVSSESNNSNFARISFDRFYYGVTDIAVNTDESSLIKATIHQEGPLKTATLLGSIEIRNDKTYMHFTQMDLRKKSYAVDAVAVDPNSELPAIPGNVDRHIIARYGALIGFSFLDKFADSYIDTTTRTDQNGATIEGTSAITDNSVRIRYALGKAVGKITPLGEEYFKRPPTITIPKQQGVGIWFLSPIFVEKK